MKTRRAILTGFEPFGPYRFNPVQDAALKYDRRRVGDIEVVGVVVPSTYRGAGEVLSEKIDKMSPDIVLSTGLASRVRRIRLEAYGRNRMNGKYPDADGYEPQEEPIIPDGQPFFQTNADNKSLARTLRKPGIFAEVSEDADAFICNSLIYLTARKIELGHLPIAYAFFHTPWTSDYAGMIELEPGKITIDKDKMMNAIRIVLLELGKGKPE